VGKATVYRSFPSKGHLMAAVAIERLEWMADLAHAALADEDAAHAVERVFADILEHQAGDLAVAGSLAAADELPEVESAAATLTAAFDALIARGRLEGALRDDASHEEIALLMGGAARMLREQGERDPDVWRRYGKLVAAALRA